MQRRDDPPPTDCLDWRACSSTATRSDAYGNAWRIFLVPARAILFRRAGSGGQDGYAGFVESISDGGGDLEAVEVAQELAVLSSHPDNLSALRSIHGRDYLYASAEGLLLGDGADSRAASYLCSLLPYYGADGWTDGERLFPCEGDRALRPIPLEIAVHPTGGADVLWEGAEVAELRPEAGGRWAVVEAQPRWRSFAEALASSATHDDGDESASEGEESAEEEEEEEEEDRDEKGAADGLCWDWTACTREKRNGWIVGVTPRGTLLFHGTADADRFADGDIPRPPAWLGTLPTAAQYAFSDAGDHGKVVSLLTLRELRTMEIARENLDKLRAMFPDAYARARVEEGFNPGGWIEGGGVRAMHRFSRADVDERVVAFFCRHLPALGFDGWSWKRAREDWHDEIVLCRPTGEVERYPLEFRLSRSFPDLAIATWRGRVAGVLPMRALFPQADPGFAYAFDSTSFYGPEYEANPALVADRWLARRGWRKRVDAFLRDPDRPPEGWLSPEEVVAAVTGSGGWVARPFAGL
jgi:hypothetical protein